MKTLKVACNLPYSKLGSYRDSNPYVHCFVFPRRGEPKIYRGGLNEVTPLIEKEHSHAIVHEVFYDHGETRLFIKVLLGRSDLRCYLHAVWKPRDEFSRKNKKVWCLTIYKKGSGVLFEKIFRRPPRRWIKELDQFITSIPMNINESVDKKELDQFITSIPMNINESVDKKELMDLMFRTPCSKCFFRSSSNK